MAVRRSSSLSDVPETPSNLTFDTMRPLISSSDNHDSKLKKELLKKTKKESLRRSKSTPAEKKERRQSHQLTHPDLWKSAWDKERGYVTDLIAEEKPITNQPQLSYFAYLGNANPRKARYQAVSSDADVIINLGNGIFAQNRAHTHSEQKEFQGNTVHISEPIKPNDTQLLECCTCMCCVKAVFYHCTKDGEFERNWADEPCTCEVPGTDCAARWGILGMFSLVMPCLVCYPVIRFCCNSSINLLRT